MILVYNSLCYKTYKRFICKRTRLFLGLCWTVEAVALLALVGIAGALATCALLWPRQNGIFLRASKELMNAES